MVVPVVRQGARWLVPLEFLTRALAPNPRTRTIAAPWAFIWDSLPSGASSLTKMVQRTPYRAE